MICPCCGQRVDHEDPDRIAFVAGLTPTEAKLFAFVMAQAPKPARRDRIIWHLWGDDIDGGPECADSNVSVYVTKISAKLAPQRLRLTSIVNGVHQGGLVVVPVPATHVKHSANVGAGHG